jgi:serine/threonine protein kinase
MRYYYLEGVEPLGEYEPGGYHPLMPDDLLCDGRYRIVHKLGYGGYSVIWLARDQKEDKYVALKIYKAHGTAHVRREVRALRELRDSKTVPKILDEFSVIGINGTHACYTMEVAAGSLASARYNDVFPIKTARALSAKLALIMLSFHSKGYCHGGAQAYSADTKWPMLTNS